MINDGYGDSPSENSESEILDSYTNWIHRIALKSLRRSDARFDDAVQEARIAAWKALKEHTPDRGPLDYWVKQRIHWTILDIVQDRRPFTGEKRAAPAVTQTRGTESREKIRAFLRTNTRATNKEISAATGLTPATISYHMKRMTHDVEKPATTLLSALMEDPQFDIVAAGDLLESVTEAYHNGEISEALNVLTANERRYVSLRFWEELTHAEIAEKFGYNPGAVWTQAKKKLKPKLQHLIGV